MAISSACLVALLFAPQAAPEDAAATNAVRAKSDAWVVSGVASPDGTLPLGALQLGDGGIGELTPGGEQAGPGAYRTRGGVLVRAQVEGVKLDFPSGGELLVDPTARVHERGGRATPKDRGGVRVWLADGTMLQAMPRASGRVEQLEWVQVRCGDEFHTLWQTGRPRARAALARTFHGRTYAALGDGRVLYELAQLGPMVVATIALCPAELDEEYPSRAVILSGDVLMRSLLEIERVAMQRAANEPRTQAQARGLAALAPQLFPPGTVKFRPPGAVGELVLPMGGSFRLDVDVRTDGSAVVALGGPSGDTPLCEWHVLSNTTLLHLIERRKLDEEPRFAMQGHDLRHLVEPLLPFDRSPNAVGRARHTLVELGG